MEKFFYLRDSWKLSNGNTCCRLFVTDKGFMYVVPIKPKKEVIQAVKQFPKEIGAPDATVSDAAPDQKSQALQNICTDMSTTLIVL